MTILIPPHWYILQHEKDFIVQFNFNYLVSHTKADDKINFYTGFPNACSMILFYDFLNVGTDGQNIKQYGYAESHDSVGLQGNYLCLPNHTVLDCHSGVLFYT